MVSNVGAERGAGQSGTVLSSVGDGSCGWLLSRAVTYLMLMGMGWAVWRGEQEAVGGWRLGWRARILGVS